MTTAVAVPKRTKPSTRKIPNPPTAQDRKQHLDVDSSQRLKPLDNGNNMIREIEIARIKPHAGNRTIDAADPSLYDLVKSIDELGQLEPITVRAVGSGEFELLSGERRYLACLKLGRTTMRCIVADDDDQAAIVRLAAANTNRKDLNPIERAKLIELLMQPIDRGGSGLDRLAAGRAVGLTSESGVKNALRMLKLPTAIRNLVIVGEISERGARRLIPFVEMPEVIQSITKELTGTGAKTNIDELAMESETPWWLERILEKDTRPLDNSTITSNLVAGYYTKEPILFEPDEKQFDRHELTIDGEKRVVTTNTKLWDKLQKPFLQAKFDAKKNGSKPKAAAKSQSKPLSEKDKAADEKRRAKEADQRLDLYTNTWTCFALRCQLAAEADQQQRIHSLGYLTAFYQTGSNQMSTIVTEAYEESGIDVIADKHKDSRRTRLPKRVSNKQADDLNAMQHLHHMWGLMLWPVSFAATIEEVELPDLDRLPYLSPEMIRELSAWCKITIADFWKAAANEGSMQYQLMAIWLGRHTTDQLQQLWEQLNLPTTQLSKRSELVEAMVTMHTSKRLPLPKRLLVQ